MPPRSHAAATARARCTAFCSIRFTRAAADWRVRRDRRAQDSSPSPIAGRSSARDGVDASGTEWSFDTAGAVRRGAVAARRGAVVARRGAAAASGAAPFRQMSRYLRRAPVATEFHVAAAATSLHRSSTSQPRRRRDSPTEYPRRESTSRRPRARRTTRSRPRTSPRTPRPPSLRRRTSLRAPREPRRPEAGARRARRRRRRPPGPRRGATAAPPRRRLRRTPRGAGAAARARRRSGRRRRSNYLCRWSTAVSALHLRRGLPSEVGDAGPIGACRSRRVGTTAPCARSPRRAACACVGGVAVGWSWRRCGPRTVNDAATPRRRGWNARRRRDVAAAGGTRGSRRRRGTRVDGSRTRAATPLERRTRQRGGSWNSAPWSR